MTNKTVSRHGIQGQFRFIAFLDECGDHFIKTKTGNLVSKATRRPGIPSPISNISLKYETVKMTQQSFGLISMGKVRPDGRPISFGAYTRTGWPMSDCTLLLSVGLYQGLKHPEAETLFCVFRGLERN